MPATRKPAPSKVRPAEATGGLGALATGIAALAGAGTELVAIVGVAAGLLPGIVTYLVTHGGIEGTIDAILHGRDG